MWKEGLLADLVDRRGRSLVTSMKDPGPSKLLVNRINVLGYCYGMETVET